MLIPIELKELEHNIKDRDFDVNGEIKLDEQAAMKVLKGIDEVRQKILELSGIINSLREEKDE